MDSERWQRIEELYHSALERTENRRSAFLRDVCEGDDELRREVELLLSHSDSTQTVLGSRVWEVVARVAETSGHLIAGTRLGPYEIMSPLGEGAMGTVYRALDIRLGRDVAIKVSTDRFSARFEREARAISALNHPNVCTLYDVGSNYLVMELVEGETIAERLDRGGPLSLKETLDIGLQIAEALDAAHRKGIVHRDLKPTNVKITPTGRVKVLDFGLAKTIRGEQDDEDGSQLIVGAALASVTGQVIGTPAYMSPEQARGETIDARTDVWAFGCLLYELLSGKHAFPGETSRDTLAVIVEGEPDWQALPLSTPTRIRELLRQCLEKDAGRRLQDIGAAGAAIEKAATAPTRAQMWGRAAAIGALVVAAILATWFLRGRDVQPEQTIHAVPLTTYPGTQDWPAFSPDGNQVAFAWDGEKQDNFDIYVKPIGPGPPLRLTHDPAAETAPAWSPDGSSIAFIRALRPGESAVVLIRLRAGPERVIGKISRFEIAIESLAWSPNSKWLVVFDRPRNEAPGLWAMSAESGERRRLTTAPALGPNSGDFAAAFAPNGRTLAFRRTVSRNSSDLFFLPLSEDMRPNGGPRRLTQDQRVIMGLAWDAKGRELIFSSGTPGDLNLFRTPISGPTRRRLTLQGEIINLTVSPRSHRLVFTQSRREMDIYRVELSGEGGEAHGPAPLIASSRLERYPNYSPDGKRIAFVSLRSGKWQLWMTDSDGRSPVQLTSFEGGELSFPVWSPDGRQIGFTADAEDLPQAYVVEVTSGKMRKLEALGTNVFNWKWSHDGRWIFFLSTRDGTEQLWKIAAAGGSPERMTRGGAGTFTQSPDGKLIYYVRPGGVWCVPVDGGPEREVFESDVAPGALDVSWFGVYFVAHSAINKNGDLMFYRFPAGPARKVAGIETAYGFSTSPDGRWLIYTKLTATGSDLMLVENFQ